MPGDALAWAAVVIVAGTATGMLMTHDWRQNLGLLALQYLGAAALWSQHLPVGMTAAKLVAGWMATASLGMTVTALRTQAEAPNEAWPRGRTFRLFMAGTVFVFATAATPRVETVMTGIGAPVIAGSIVLMGMGLLLLGTNSQPLRIVVGLLTVLSGFEILYAALEESILVTGLLAVVTLGLGLAGSYLINSAQPEEEL